MAEDKKTTLIAVDHGFSHIKTVDEIFETAITPIDEPISGKDVLQIGQRYYRIGGRRIDVLEDKTATDDFRLLTYVAIARQLARLNTKRADVTLAVGLPIGRLAKEKASFKRYLSDPPEIRYHYSETAYIIRIEDPADHLLFAVFDLLPAAGHRDAGHPCRPVGLLPGVQRTDQQLRGER